MPNAKGRERVQSSPGASRVANLATRHQTRTVDQQWTLQLYMLTARHDHKRDTLVQNRHKHIQRNIDPKPTRKNMDIKPGINHKRKDVKQAGSGCNDHKGKKLRDVFIPAYQQLYFVVYHPSHAILDLETDRNRTSLACGG
ncbi:hypothetical protein IAQ61_001827 [Plenodomus lingam]|uniref:uncharacterized protein n=1 Tax=Leptosphaeria maculans TaxID=5022 RepID=UPI0033176463|nr:hypothetical protein IAQ61_001827 [Plenodomus lingam]